MESGLLGEISITSDVIYDILCSYLKGRIRFIFVDQENSHNVLLKLESLQSGEKDFCFSL